MTDLIGNIMLVDDDRQTRLKLTRILESQGLTVRAVESGDSALDLLTSESFDVILLDILMPGMDGFEVLQKLQADTRLGKIPVIVISALDDPEGEDKCTALGARSFLAKPVDVNLLRARVKDCLDSREGS